VSFRLAVLSDLHVDSRADADSWALAKTAFEAVAEERADHIVNAGDLRRGRHCAA
jgi:3',5'-cyclic AMP phosphodiesterase CpdA